MPIFSNSSSAIRSSQQVYAKWGGLRDPFKYLFNLTTEIDAEKARGWVQVILAFIIDHTDEARLRRRCIRKNLIDFSRCQQVWVITLDADRKFSLTLCSTHIQSRNRLKRIFFRPMPCASNQCNSAIRLVPSGRRTRPCLSVFSIGLAQTASLGVSESGRLFPQQSVRSQ
jgi:hypothetical protein